MSHGRFARSGLSKSTLRRADSGVKRKRLYTLQPQPNAASRRLAIPGGKPFSQGGIQLSRTSAGES